MNLRYIVNRLQTALVQRGRRIKINQFQSFPAGADHAVTKYVLQERRKDKRGVEKNVTLLETFKLSEAVTKLAEELAAGGG